MKNILVMLIAFMARINSKTVLKERYLNENASDSSTKKEKLPDYNKIPYPNYPVNITDLGNVNSSNSETPEKRTKCINPDSSNNESNSNPPEQTSYSPVEGKPPKSYNPKDPVIPGIDHYYDIVNKEIELPMVYNITEIAKHKYYSQKQLAMECSGNYFPPRDYIKFMVGVKAYFPAFISLDQFDFIAGDMPMAIKEDKKEITIRYYKLPKARKPKPEEIKETDDPEEREIMDLYKIYLHRRYFMLEELRAARLFTFMPYYDENLRTAGKKAKTAEQIANDKKRNLKISKQRLEADITKHKKHEHKSLYLPIELFKSIVRVAKKEKERKLMMKRSRNSFKTLKLPLDFFKNIVLVYNKRKMDRKLPLNLTGTFFAKIAREYALQQKRMKVTRNERINKASSNKRNLEGCKEVRNIESEQTIRDTYNDLEFSLNEAKDLKNKFKKPLMKPKYDISYKTPNLIKNYCFEDEKEIVVFSIRKKQYISFKPKSNPRKLLKQWISVLNSLKHYHSMNYVLITINYMKFCIKKNKRMKPFICDITGMVRANEPQRLKLVKKHIAPEVIKNIQVTAKGIMIASPEPYTYTFAADVYAIGLEFFKMLYNEEFTVEMDPYIDGLCGTLKCYNKFKPRFKEQLLRHLDLDEKETDENKIIKKAIEKKKILGYLLFDFIEKMIAFNPKDRPSVNEVIAELHKFITLTDDELNHKIKKKERSLRNLKFSNISELNFEHNNGKFYQLSKATKSIYNHYY